MTNKNQQFTNSDLIEKYSGDFSKEEFGVTLIPTKTIQSIKSTTDLGLYTYLASCPPGWRINPRNISAHFECNKDKIYKSIDSLIKQGLLSRTQNRNNGKFVDYSYKLHLRPENKKSEFTSPCPEKPDPVKPDTENPDAYITYNINNKEFIKQTDNKTYSSSDDEREKVKEKKAKSIDDSYLDLFEKFYSIYPRKKGKQYAIKWFKREKPSEAFVDMIINDIKKRLETEWLGKDAQYLPYPASYLNGKRWEDEQETIDTTLLKQLKSPAVLESAGKEMAINPNYEYPETYFMQTVNTELTKAQISTFDEMYDMYPASASYEQCKAEWFKKGCHLIAREVIFPTLKEQIAKDRRFQTSRYIPSLLNYISKMSWMDKIVSDDKSKGRFDHDNMSWALDSRKSILE